MSMRLKLLRKKLGITLETLVDKTGLAKSYLSRVERGLDVLSIATVPKLVKALNVQVEELFSEEGGGVDGYSIIHRGQRRSLSNGDDSPAYASLAQQINARALLPFSVHPSRDFSHLTFKEHLGGKSIFVHEGQIEVDFVDQRITLERGDALCLSVQKPHRIRSLGGTQAELLVMIHSDK